MLKFSVNDLAERGIAFQYCVSNGQLKRQPNSGTLQVVLYATTHPSSSLGSSSLNVLVCKGFSSHTSLISVYF